MINPVKSFLTHGPLILKEIYTNKFQKYTHVQHVHNHYVQKNCKKENRILLLSYILCFFSSFLYFLK